MIGFKEENHEYFSLDGADTKWISVTKLIHHFVEPFNKEEKAAKCSVRKPGRWGNKWYGMRPEEIIAAWDNENKRSTDLGRWYHQCKEQQIYRIRGDARMNESVGGIKIAPPQKLTDGIYPEHMMYLESVGICGQSDEPEVLGNVLNIMDSKTNKEIKKVGFTNWEGVTKKLLKPLHHLDDCELNLYSLQLSLYAHIMLRHNPNLKLGKLTIEHVKFVETGKDEYGYPLLLIENGEPVIDTVELIECKYMKSEVNTLINWLKDTKNRQQIINSKH